MKNNANLDVIKERLNILDIVSNYIKLEKSGNQFKARCPFHNERTPSFYISPSRGTYHCFGCSEHGDIFGFIMKIEGVPFKESLKMLADKAGIVLTYNKNEEKSSSLDILEYAAQYWSANLEINKFAKEYLHKRGLTDETIKKWRIGFASNEWREIYHKLQNQNFTDAEILESGLCIKAEKEGRTTIYDRFRSRIMFPIMNSSGKVVAFTGRIIGQDDGKDGVAKYVNSPETQIYHKSSILFGYDKARMEIAKQKKILVVEGQMDCIMASQAGNTNVVAISGTAFTQEHINIIKRFSEKVVLALDSDNAGFSAMLKSANIALSNDLEVLGLEIKDGKDPADMILKDPQMWRNTVYNEKSIFVILTQIILEKFDSKITQMQKVKKEIIPLLASLKSDLLKDVYISEISEILNVEKETIKSEIKNFLMQNIDTQINFQRTETREEKLEKAKANIMKNKSLEREILYALAFGEFVNKSSISPELSNLLKNILGEYKEILNLEVNDDFKEVEYLKIEKDFGEMENVKLENVYKDVIKNICKKILTAVREIYQEKMKDLENNNSEEILKNIQTISKKMMEINML
jgi:DNA primase